MADKRHHPEITRLTLKKAKQLAKQEFGTAKGLKHESGDPIGLYSMDIGNLEIRIHPHHCGPAREERFEIRVGMKGAYRSSWQLHDPETLQQDFEAEERYRQIERRALMEELMEETDV